MGRRGRRYTRRAKSFLSKVGGISGLGTAVNAAYQLGAPQAANTLIQTGDIQAAAEEMRTRATVQNVVAGILPVILVAGVKKAVRGAGIKIPGWL